MFKHNKISPFLFKIMMGLYPPFLFGRVRVKEVSPDYMMIKVCVKRSFLNNNLSGTMFGGTLFSAADPFFALMYWQVFAHRYQQKVKVWLKSAEIKYKKPSVGNIYLEFRLEEEDILKAKADLDIIGKHSQSHEVLLKNKKGEVCAIVNAVTYVGLT
jgi:acyl-coenzyme A thioesterase PaaI-like protein